MLKLDNISKSYGGFSLQDISLKINRGEYFVLLGRSGSGKSQLLEVISGLRRADSGNIVLNDIDITTQKIQTRPVGFVFQDFALFPHLSVFDNIAFPLRMLKTSREEIESKVNKIAFEINIERILDRKPEMLSGGEKQRVAVARTLVRSPKIILLDEPMASIDTPLRDDIRRLLRRINRGGITILHVTHDYKEAIRLADRVGVIHQGRIIQIGKPEEVFNNPVNRFVARFAGIQNFFKIKIDIEKDTQMATGRNGFRFLLPPGEYPQDAIAMLHSDKIVLSTEQADNEFNSTIGEIIEINRAEHGYEAYIKAEETFYVTFSEQLLSDLGLETGMMIGLSFKEDALKVI